VGKKCRDGECGGAVMRGAVWRKRGGGIYGLAGAGEEAGVGRGVGLVSVGSRCVSSGPGGGGGWGVGESGKWLVGSLASCGGCWGAVDWASVKVGGANMDEKRWQSGWKRHVVLKNKRVRNSANCGRA